MPTFNKLYIANRMLLAAGQQTIANLGVGTKAERLIKVAYDGFVNEVFAYNITWKFASSRAQLAELSTTPAFGWDHQFAAPQGMIRVIKTVDEQGDDIHYDYRREVVLLRQGNKTVEKDVLLTNQDDMFVRYLFVRANPASWPGWFQRLVIFHGAMQLVTPIKKDDFTALNLQRQYVDALSKAKGANAAEDSTTNDQAQDIDMGNTDFEDAVRNSFDIKVWDTSSENRS